MRQLLENDIDRADVNVRDLDGKTPLFYVLRHADAMRLLIEFGADVNVRDAGGATAVKLAAAYWLPGQGLDIVRMLLDVGADANVAANDGQTALHLYFREGSDQIVKLLIARGANVNASSTIGRPLHFAARRGSIECMRLLLEHGADPHARSPKGGWTALHLAAKSRNPREAVRLLVKAGADANAVDDKGWTPMHVLIWHHQCFDVILFAPVTQENESAAVITLDVVRLLMANGADINSVKVDGATPLFTAYATMLFRLFPKHESETFDAAQRVYDLKV